VSICPDDDDASDSEDSELESSVDILSSELSEFTVFKISSLQITFHFFNFLMSEIHIKMQIMNLDILN